MLKEAFQPHRRSCEAGPLTVKCPDTACLPSPAYIEKTTIHSTIVSRISLRIRSNGTRVPVLSGDEVSDMTNSFLGVVKECPVFI
jgi:hypothetical protein